MWWYSQNGQTSGPFPEEQLKDRLRSGELDGEQFACSEGSSDWLHARQVLRVDGDAESWWYSRCGQSHGPFTEAQLGDMLLAATLQPQDVVWNERLANWTPACQVVTVVEGPKTWWYSRNGQAVGPVAFEQLKWMLRFSGAETSGGGNENS